MGFLSWLTGRDEKEQDVYANYERVDAVSYTHLTLPTKA